MFRFPWLSPAEAVRGRSVFAGRAMVRGRCRRACGGVAPFPATPMRALRGSHVAPGGSAEKARDFGARASDCNGVGAIPAKRDPPIPGHPDRPALDALQRVVRDAPAGKRQVRLYRRLRARAQGYHRGSALPGFVGTTRHRRGDTGRQHALVEIRLGPKPVRLGPSAFFGEVAVKRLPIRLNSRIRMTKDDVTARSASRGPGEGREAISGRTSSWLPEIASLRSQRHGEIAVQLRRKSR
jgi:hypothetical protein